MKKMEQEQIEEPKLESKDEGEIKVRKKRTRGMSY